jgi:16S rRNA (cytosine967-C5)-methyltransferase
MEGPDAAWLDMCAGPGGKAALLGAIAATRGATLDALELHAHRAQLVGQATRALPPGTVTVHTADATAWTGGPYDRILLDAPCTGLGALRRRPESRWRRTEADLDDLTALQLRLLTRAGELLRPGGIIAYVTCSPVLAETRDIVASSGLRALDARAALAQATGDPDGWGRGPEVQLWTHVHGTDSMFIALLTRD